MATTIQVRVLGPVVVEVDGQRIDLAGKLERGVVSALVLGLGHVVSVDHLVASLWGEDPPATAHAIVQSVVSRLRAKVTDDFIQADDHGYRLEVAADGVDAVRFERLLDTAMRSLDTDPPRAGDLARQALDLWRGDAFGQLGEEPPFSLEARRLSELRDVAIEVRVEADLSTGDPRRAIPRLENLVEAHPYNERLWYLLAWSLASNGRRTEALRVCRGLRTVLAEVGLEAGQDITAIEDEILAGRLIPETGRSPV
ncbi:MAG: AfsR/SARP family transcriptional regulator [Acidimicrobiia bacterium]|nr:AfsR/SARP family transcriptional regulator [Acidimicrobiia bacterium]